MCGRLHASRTVHVLAVRHNGSLDGEVVYQYPHFFFPTTRRFFMWYKVLVLWAKIPILMKVPCLHLLLVLLFCALMIYTHLVNPGNPEANLAWMVFLGIDFPVSIIVFATSGASVVSVPIWVNDLWLSMVGSAGGDASGDLWLLYDCLLYDVLWPGFVFQVVGTVNWVLIVSVLLKVRKLDSCPVVLLSNREIVQRFATRNTGCACPASLPDAETAESCACPDSLSDVESVGFDGKNGKN